MKRLRISRFADLNDPFELLSVNLKHKWKREAFRRWKSQVHEKYGLVCFSGNWESPLLWSHYGDRHRGLCLGFDVPDDKVVPVRYEDTRSELADETVLDESTVMQFISTKFVDWCYEKEVRIVTDLTEYDRSDGNYYVDLGADLQLKEVIVGTLSEVSRADIRDEIDKAGLDSSQIQLVKARLAFGSYAVVPDKRGLC